MFDKRYCFYFQTDFVYDVAGDKPGLALIINNVNFKKLGKDYERHGSDKDYQSLADLFKSMGMHLHSDGRTRDLRADQMDDILKEVATLANNNYKFLVVVIMSHGGKDEIFGADYSRSDAARKTLNVTKIISQFMENPFWNGKPKLFFFQACQGPVLDRGFDEYDFPDGSLVASG